jgi:hypothetical protein
LIAAVSFFFCDVPLDFWPQLQHIHNQSVLAVLVHAQIV